MRTTAAMVVIVAAVLYIGPLFLDAPLTDPDEGLHATIAQEMLQRGDLVVPRFAGRAFLDKPVLFFWTQTASIAALGDSTAAARLPGLLFALLGIATTGWLARTLFTGQPDVGWIAATCYATMALPFMLAQAPVHDMALVPFTNFALGFLWRAREGPSARSSMPNAQGSMLNAQAGFAGIALGLSILAKGLEGVAIVGVGYGLYLLVMRAVTLKIAAQGVLVLAIACLVALPWYLAMNAREPGYLRYYLVDRHLLGFATDTQRHGGQPWWFYLPLALGGGMPWILYLSGGRAKGTGGSGRGSSDVLLWTWLLGAFVLLSFAGSKSVTYLLPAMPAIAILAGRSWSVAADALRARVLAHGVLFLIIATLAPWAASRYAGRPATAAEIGAFGALAAIWLWMTLRVTTWPVATGWRRLAIATAATYALAFALLGPPLARAHSARDLAAYFNAAGRLPGTVYIMDGRVSFVYYLRPELRRQLRGDQVQSVSVEQLAALQPFPRDAIVALPADLAGRLAHVPQLAHASRQAAGRYEVVSPY